MAFDDQSEGQPSPEALAAVQQFSSAAPSQAPEVSAQGDAPSDEARRAVAAFLAEPAAEKAAKPGRAAPPHPITPLAPRSPVAPKGPTRYMAAVAKPKPAERELTLGQTAQGFAKNLQNFLVGHFSPDAKLVLHRFNFVRSRRILLHDVGIFRVLNTDLF